MPLPRQPHAVVFDMDGLIFDTETLARDAISTVAQAGGYDMPLSFILTMIGLPGEATRAMLHERFGPPFDYDVFWPAVAKRFNEVADTQLRLKAGVVELLDALDRASLPRAIATSSSHRSVQHHLGAHGLLNRFQAIVAHGDYTRGKPNPDPFLKAAESLGVEPAECVALEDSYAGVRAASGAGMMTIMVPDLLVPTAEMESLCVCIVPDLHQVLTLLELGAF